MSGWAAIQKHLRGRYRLQVDEPDMMAMTWSYDDGRAQKILVRRFTSSSRDHVEFKSPFAREGEVDPIAVLRDNAKLPLGAVALSGDVFIVIHNALLSTIGPDDVDFVLERVAAIADSLEEKYARKDAF